MNRLDEVRRAVREIAGRRSDVAVRRLPRFVGTGRPRAVVFVAWCPIRGGEATAEVCVSFDVLRQSYGPILAWIGEDLGRRLMSAEAAFAMRLADPPRVAL